MHRHGRSEDRRKPAESQIGKGPDREPEEATLQREAKDARNRYRGRTRTAGVVWNGERAPERGGDQWNGEGNQDPQPVITPMPVIMWTTLSYPLNDSWPLPHMCAPIVSRVMPPETSMR